ncbi:MAG: acylphosphatase [bacterium]
MGYVQGVFFRYCMQKEALKFEVKGWVKNLSNGQVEAVLEGEEQNIACLIKWANKGPSEAKVKNVKIIYEKYIDEFTNFEIKY